ncbi:hypothetical protein NDU88_002889 [Pleurodeles waltl]|uniref:Uncharacterized protein n=1 Tax=Pleurodeles waltl TaxID=8319 RepID=A0AAV7W0K7_PLEWA|nr:hypothetical protein NDU88_002889 [Pleurodeles waltl]
MPQTRRSVMKMKEEAEIEGGTCNKDNGGKWKRHPQETHSRWLEKKSLHRDRDKTRQCQTEDDRGRGRARAGNVLGRTWPEKARGVYWGMGRKEGKAHL